MNGAELFIKRTAMGLEVEHAASVLGINRRTLQRWETGQNVVPPDIQILMEEHWQEWIETLDNLLAETDSLADPGQPIHLIAYRDSQLAAKNAALAVLLEMADRGFTAEWTAG
ncbi:MULTISPECIES: hypothetical protein [Trueperella]|uniref:hypothetical protein n=1 Tax=Trueperella TaxID=1069494 RepID=UPI0008A167D4|nr:MULTISPECIES: hypothetical protein [Trueperella]OFS67504.1 hypothetical protein HMPREF3174_03500 [Trueperella sp. HMSC08H06]